MGNHINIILLGVNYFGITASAQRVKNLFEPLLNKQGLKICNIVINEHYFNIELSKIVVKKFKYNYKNIFSIIYFLCGVSRFIIKYYKKNELNVIYHYQYPSIEDIIFLKIAQMFGYYIVYDITENIDFYDNSRNSIQLKFKNFTSQKLVKQLYKNGSLCFAISSGLVAFCKKICKDKIPVIYLPVSVKNEYINNFKKIKHIKSDLDRIQIFYGGSFGFKDGFEYLLKGFELACEYNSNIDLILTGNVSKQMKDEVPLLLASSKWKDRIKFLGFLIPSNYYSTMVNADILCVCRINSEFANYGFPFKLGEYLASGNAIIATNVGDIPKYLINYENALIIQPESIYQICDAILMLAKDSMLRLRIGEAAYETSIKYFSAEKISQMFFQYILNISLRK